MLKTYIATKLAVVAASDTKSLVAEFGTYLYSKKDEISQAIDKTFKEEVSQVRDAFKTLESSINKQLENDDKLSNEDFNEIYHMTEFSIKLYILDENIQQTEYEYSDEAEKSLIVLYGDKLNDNSRKEVCLIFHNFFCVIDKIFKHVKNKRTKRLQNIITQFWEKYPTEPQKQEIYEICEIILTRKLWEKCNLKFERKKENEGTKRMDNIGENNEVKNDNENKDSEQRSCNYTKKDHNEKRDSNNKSLIIKTVGGTVFFHIPIYGCTGYLLYDKLFKKNQTNISENEPTPDVAAPAA